MSTIAVRDIWKKYKETQALEDLNFETKEGELFCILGPSGAGKNNHTAGYCRSGKHLIKVKFFWMETRLQI